MPKYLNNSFAKIYLEFAPLQEKNMYHNTYCVIVKLSINLKGDNITNSKLFWKYFALWDGIINQEDPRNLYYEIAGSVFYLTLVQFFLKSYGSW